MKSKNRLKLDFTLQTDKERSQFLKQYIDSLDFKLNEEEKETCANYVLYGKEENGKSPVQNKKIFIQTKNSSWTKKDEESLDALMESPVFNEALIQKPSEARPKIPRQTFNREKELGRCPQPLKPILNDLFRQIDETDLVINFYEEAHNKRKSPIREELLDKFDASQKEKLREASTHLNQFQYLKKRHHLVELRQQQFSLKDSYVSRIQLNDMLREPTLEDTPKFGVEFQILPMGAINGEKLNDSGFKPLSGILPSNFSQEEIEFLVGSYWRRLRENQQVPFFFNFEELEHVYQLIQFLNEFQGDIQELKVEDTLKTLLDTLEFYIEQTDLTDIQREILDRKIHHQKNKEIAAFVNKKWGKQYTDNYISTIFRQKIVKKINETATYHKELILNLPYPENFKKCTNCGRWLLIDSRNFVKKSRSKDGFTNRCKVCDKFEREIKKR